MPKSLTMCSSWFFSSVFSLLLLITITKAQDQTNIFNVVEYGAVDDGSTDASTAIFSAWSVACQFNGSSEILIPDGTYLVNPLRLKGPCNGQLSLNIIGKLIAPTEKEYWYDIDHWITFRYINGFEIGGNGVLDGQGKSAWSSNTCLKDPNCKKLPASLRLDFVKNSRIKDISLIDSKNVHINIFACNNITIKGIKIQAPAKSPNTDGIHIGLSTNISILDSEISTGDDCVSLSPGANNLDIENVKCGPGHGIGIGSIGGFRNEKDIDGLVVRNCTFIGTQNGLRIKTWAHSHSTNVSNITFEHIKMTDVSNPIVIDQEYCPSRNCSKGYSSRVQIRDVRFKDIHGTSNSKIAVKFKCSETKPCKNIVLKDINLQYTHGIAHSQCSNVIGVACGEQKPPSCIEQCTCLNRNPIY